MFWLFAYVAIGVVVAVAVAWHVDATTTEDGAVAVAAGVFWPAMAAMAGLYGCSLWLVTLNRHMRR